MYRTIDTALWYDPHVRQMEAPAKLLFLYLITNPHSHVSGIYYIPECLVVEETGMSREGYRKGIDTLSRSGLVRFDHNLSVVWVRNMFRYQGQHDKTLRAAGAQLGNLHKSPLIKEFLKEYPKVKQFYKDRVSIGYPKKVEFGIQEQEQEQDYLLPAVPAEQSQASASKPETALTPSDCASETAQTPSGEKAKTRGKPTAPRPTHPRDELFDAVAKVTASDPAASGSYIGRVCKALRAADPPYTPAEVLALPAAIQNAGLDFLVTLGSVEKYIGWVRSPPTTAAAQAHPRPTSAERNAKLKAEREAEERERARLEAERSDPAILAKIHRFAGKVSAPVDEEGTGLNGTSHG